MTNEEANKVLEELHEVRPEMLNDKAEADLYEANNRIVDLMNIIDEMAKDIYDSQIECYRYFKDIEDVKKYFEERCK